MRIASIGNNYYGAAPPPVFPDGIMNDYANGTVCFSLQRHNKNLTDVVQVRNTSNSATEWFTPEEVADGTLLTWLGSNTGRIVTLVNQDLSGNDLTEAFTNGGAIIAQGGSLYLRMGLPSMYFNGASAMRTTTNIIAANDSSFYSIGAASSTQTLGTVASLHLTTTQTTRIFVDTRITVKRNAFGYGSGGNAAADLSTFRVDTNDRLLEAHINSSYTIRPYDNKTLGVVATPSGTVSSLYGFQIGRQSGSLTYMNGYISMVIGFNVNNEAQRTSIVTDIESIYGSF